MADLLAVLYGRVLRYDAIRPDWADRDRFLLSKGHGAAALYAVLAESGFIPVADLESFSMNGSALLAHASHHVPGVELSTGSLGHALPVGCGLALAMKRDRRGSRVCVLLSDGELDEGSNWEAILFAPHHKLGNLLAVVDYNRIQSYGRISEVLALEPLADKWRAFGWEVREVNGHDHAAVLDVCAAPGQADVPVVVVAHTIKGKGVSFMENELAWHYRSPDPDQLRVALRELGVES